MPYLSVPQLQAVLSHDGQHTGTAASLSPTVLAERIDAGQGEVDGRLAAAGYTVPFDDAGVPPLVRDLVGAVAAYLADLTYRRGKAPSGELDPVLQRYRWATGLLDKIGAGTALVPGVPAPGGGSATDERGVEVVAAIDTYDGRLFGTDILDIGPRPGDDPWWW